MIKYINTSQNTVNGNDSFFTSQSFDQVMATGMLKLVPDYLIKEKFRKVNKQIYTELINTLYYWNEKSHGVNFDIILRTTKESPQSDFFYVDPIRDTDITYFLNKKIIKYPNLFINFSDIPKTVNQLKNKIKTLFINDNSKNYGMFSIECPKMPRLFRDKDYTEAASNGIEDFNKLIKDLKKNRFNMINLKYIVVFGIEPSKNYR